MKKVNNTYDIHNFVKRTPDNAARSLLVQYEHMFASISGGILEKELIARVKHKQKNTKERNRGIINGMKSINLIIRLTAMSPQSNRDQSILHSLINQTT